MTAREETGDHRGTIGGREQLGESRRRHALAHGLPSPGLADEQPDAQRRGGREEAAGKTHRHDVEGESGIKVPVISWLT